jgi:hypothetical protein
MPPAFVGWPSVVCGIIGVVPEFMVRMQPALGAGHKCCGIICSANQLALAAQADHELCHNTDDVTQCCRFNQLALAAQADHELCNHTDDVTQCCRLNQLETVVVREVWY